MMNPLKLKIPSLPENIRIVESFIDQAKENFRFDDDIYGNIMIAITESVNNAIMHGNKNDKQKNVHLSLEVNERNIAFVVEDEGEGFKYDDLPDPTAPENIEKPGGRGIFLIRHLADEVKFFERGNKVKITFYLTN